MLIHVGILCCASVQITYKLSVLKFFRWLVDHCRISCSPLQVIFYQNICITIGFPVALVLQTLMSAKPVEISDHGKLTGRGHVKHLTKLLGIGQIWSSHVTHLTKLLGIGQIWSSHVTHLTKLLGIGQIWRLPCNTHQNSYLQMF